MSFWTSIFGGNDGPSIHDEFHEYTRDIAHLQKIRDSQMQRMILTSDEVMRDRIQQEITRTDSMIEIAQKAILELTEADARRRQKR